MKFQIMVDNIKSIFAALLIIATIIAPQILVAQNDAPADDCYINNFEDNITAQIDGNLLITEKIVADCGNLTGKHGIYRVVPTSVKTQGGDWETPVKLISITDENGNSRNYTTQSDLFDHTLSWKIGDPDIEISGKNTYIISYLVSKAIRSGKDDDELYWNLLGNFWDMEINSFSAKMTFPEGIGENDTEVYLYSGQTGEKDSRRANWHWDEGKIIEINSIGTIYPQQGITVSVTFPKGKINAYQPTVIDLYGNYFWMILPLAAFIAAFFVWFKYGKDPKTQKTIIPEFDVPGRLTPLQLGLLENNGSFGNKLLPAALVDLAVKKIIAINEIKKTWALGSNDYRIKLIDKNQQLNEPEKALLAGIFKKNQMQVNISDLKNDFYAEIPKIRKSAINKLISDGYINSSGLTLKKVFLIIGLITVWISVFFADSSWAIGSLVTAGAIFIGFAFVMPKRTPKGAEVYWQIQGFKLYMKTAEKYRQQFNERENIFEKLLPYAMVFGMAKLWIKKMEEIYGKEYFNNYHPGWYTGILASNFNADSFTSQINSMSASIAANIGTTSGSHGSGGVGGGGGGGGGGSW